MTLEAAILLLAFVPALLRGWLGWRLGATVEARWVLTVLFATLVAVRFWAGLTESLSKILVTETQFIAVGVFLVLFIAAFAFGALIFGLRASVYQSVLPNYFDQVLGGLMGLFSGLMLGGAFLLVVVLGLPDFFDSSKLPARLENVPQAVYEVVEQNVANIPAKSPSRTLFPSVDRSDASKPPALVWN